MIVSDACSINVLLAKVLALACFVNYDCKWCHSMGHHSRVIIYSHNIQATVRNQAFLILLLHLLIYDRNWCHSLGHHSRVIIYSYNIQATFHSRVYRILLLHLLIYDCKWCHNLGHHSWVIIYPHNIQATVRNQAFLILLLHVLITIVSDATVWGITLESSFTLIIYRPLFATRLFLSYYSMY